MEIKGFNDYAVANIQQEDLVSICELEKTLSTKANKDIVLIAYQPSDKAEV